MGEVGHAVTQQRLGLEEGNALVLRLLAKYEHVFDQPAGNPGARFDQAYDMTTLTPVPEWQRLYEEVKTDVRRDGFERAELSDSLAARARYAHDQRSRPHQRLARHWPCRNCSTSVPCSARDCWTKTSSSGAANGRLLAWQDLCVHRGTRLSLGRVADDQLHCPYHGWVYGPDGGCTHIPAHPGQKPPTKARVKTYQARERYGLIWVSLGEPPHDIPPFPQWEDDSYRKILCGPYDFAAAGTRAIENFLDVAHFPFVHEGFLGDPQFPEIGDYEARIGPEGVVAEDISVYQPNPDGSGQGARVTYTYRVLRPLTAHFIKSSAGPSFAAYFTICPVAELACTRLDVAGHELRPRRPRGRDPRL